MAIANGNEKTMKTKKNTKTVNTNTMPKAKAVAAWNQAKLGAITAHGVGQKARRDIGAIAADAEAQRLAYQADTAVSKRTDADAAKVDTSARLAEAIAEAYPDDAPTRWDIHTMKRHHLVVTLMERRTIGTEAQRRTLSEGAARKVPASMSDANAEKLLAKAAKAQGTERITAEAIANAMPAKKKTDKKKAETKATAPDMVAPADVLAFIIKANASAEANGTKVSDDMAADIAAASAEYVATLTK